MSWPILTREQFNRIVALNLELQGKAHDAAAVESEYPVDEFGVRVELTARGLDCKQSTITSFGISRGIKQGAKQWHPVAIDALAARLEKQGRITFDALARGKSCPNFDQFFIALSNDLRGQFQGAVSRG